MKTFPTCLCVLILGGAGAWPAWAKGNHDAAGSNDPMARPTEYGVRFTPGMARGLGKTITRKTLAKRYQLDEAQCEQASQAVARRLMQLALANEERGQDLFEFALAELFAMAADRGMGGISPEMGKGMGQRLVPLMPPLREFIRNIGQDLRPLLATKQQLKLAADLMALHTGVDAFDKNMQQWAKGNVDPFGNPFVPQDKAVETDENGESEALKQASERAQRVLKVPWQSQWENYVEEAKAFYKLDKSQSATADSVLRETIQRAQSIAADESRRQRWYRNRLWFYMSWRLRAGGHTPLRAWIEQDFVEVMTPVKDLGEELRQRIDEIPTAAQRASARERMAKILAERGLEVDAE